MDSTLVCNILVLAD